MIQRWIQAGVIFVMTIGVVMAPMGALAADNRPLNLTTSPLPIDLTSDPGKSVSADLRVKQNSGGTEKLKVTMMKFGAYGEEGKPRLMDREPGDDYFDWVKFDKTSFDAPDNVWQTVHMTINVPKVGAAFGYYYAVVFSRYGDDVRQTGRTNAIAGGTAVLVLLDVRSPNAKRVMTLDSFESTHGVYEFLPASFNVRLHNTGNVHAVPTGNIFITKGKKPVATLNINGEHGNILPGSHRVYQVDWANGYPHYEPQVENGKVKLDKNGKQLRNLLWSNGGDGAKDPVPHLRMGKYTAHLFAVYDDGQRDVPMEATLTFWVIPWRFLAVALVIIILVVLGVWMAMRGAWRGVRRLGSRK